MSMYLRNFFLRILVIVLINLNTSIGSDTGGCNSFQNVICISMFAFFYFCSNQFFEYVLEHQCSLRKKSPYSELFWSAFFSHFSAFGLNTEIYSVSLHIQSECGKMWEKCGPE